MGKNGAWNYMEGGQRHYQQDLATLLIGAVLSVIGDNLVNAYLYMPVAKNLWDALKAKFGATDVGSEMYAMK